MSKYVDTMVECLEYWVSQGTEESKQEIKRIEAYLRKYLINKLRHPEWYR